MTPADHAEFSNLKNISARARSLRTRARLRRELSMAVDGRVEPSAWTFERNAYGKPLLCGAPASLHFSCSHTPWVSVLAVSKRHPVGIDVESTGLAFDDPSLFEDYFAEGELQDLERMPPSRRAEARARLWTLKEATVKMLGTGLSLDISNLEFEPQRDRLRSRTINGIDVSGTRFASWFIPSNAQRLSVALALKH